MGVKLEQMANLYTGQNQVRLKKDMANSGEETRTVKVLLPKAICEGRIVAQNLGSEVVSTELDCKKFTCAGDVIMKLSMPYDAAYVDENNEDLLFPSFCVVIRVKDKRKLDPMYLTAFLNSSYARESMIKKMVGSVRPMVKVADLRTLEIPELPMEKMQEIGKMYMFSTQKREKLREMIDIEDAIMENVILESIQRGLK